MQNKTVAKYLAEFLRDNGITKVFAIQGGGSARLIDAIGMTDGIDYICNQHEQASAMAADGYARASGSIGCALSTSGPGATNLLTGICGTYFDSIPVLFITGQVSSYRLKGNLNVRCMHTQETDIVKMTDHVTKYAVKLESPDRIRYELEKCLFLAKSGRPGPVLLDIPDDYQRTEIDEDSLASYYDGDEFNGIGYEGNASICYDEAVSSYIETSKRPVIIAGWGVHASNSEKSFCRLVELLGIPVVLTWGGRDLLPYDHRLNAGTVGINGTVSGNYAVSHADLIISIGARLDQHTIIVPLKDFCCDAKLIYVDIDNNEIKRFKEVGRKLDLAIREDCDVFFEKSLKYFSNTKYHRDTFELWVEEIESKKDYNKWNNTNRIDSKIVPYDFFRDLSEILEENALIFVDTGSSLVWAEQALKVKGSQRIHSSLNNTPMGYSLPAAIGAAIYTGKRVYSINGDGGLQMNIQELATLVRHNLDLKILLFDNAGYGMVQRTQDTYMNSRYEGTDIPSGLAFPDFEKVFKAYGIDVTVIENCCGVVDKLRDAFSKKGPGCVIVRVSLHEGYQSFNKLSN